MMEAERASETLDCSSILTRLVAREDFIAFSRRESFKSYKILKMYIRLKHRAIKPVRS
jgi:hypothetical protein